MPILSDGKMATKVLGVSRHQEALITMAKEPESVHAVLVDSSGSVFVYFHGQDTPRFIGTIRDQYFLYFGSPVTSWQVTGIGRTVGAQFVDGQGHLHQRMGTLGLNITMKHEQLQ